MCEEKVFEMFSHFRSNVDLCQEIGPRVTRPILTEAKSRLIPTNSRIGLLRCQF